MCAQVSCTPCEGIQEGKYHIPHDNTRKPSQKKIRVVVYAFHGDLLPSHPFPSQALGTASEVQVHVRHCIHV